MEADAMKIKRHIEKIHLAREEKFTCNKCDAKCNSRQYLREHKHKEHGKPSQCAICYKEVIGERKFIKKNCPGTSKQVYANKFSCKNARKKSLVKGII